LSADRGSKKDIPNNNFPTPGQGVINSYECGYFPDGLYGLTIKRRIDDKNERTGINDSRCKL
jgi:hypothetical protein